MASNTTHTLEAVATDLSRAQASSHTPKRRRLSWRTQLPMSDDFTPATAIDPHTALMHGHDHQGLSERTRHLDTAEEIEEAQATKSKRMDKMITPYLAQHIPQQYNPLGAIHGGLDAAPVTANTKFCYRHRPDLLCRRQADEPSMEQLQDVCIILSSTKCVC